MGTGRDILKSRNAAAAVCASLALVLAPAGAWANDAVWSLLEGGGQVVLMRHALTTPGTGDPPGMRLDDCRTQRNLSDTGRGHARQIGAAFRTRGIVVERVLTSPWCRCIETARLAFGNVDDISQPLSNLFGRHENQPSQLGNLRPLVGTWRGKGNLVLVSHGSTILALTGVSPESGEMVVVTPQADGKFSVAGRLVAHAR